MPVAPHKSNIAMLYDEAAAKLAKSLSDAEQYAMELRAKLAANAYKEHIVAAVEELLARFEQDPDLFLVNVRGAGGASPEVLLTDRGPHRMDGQGLPHEDVREFVSAITSRNEAKAVMRSNWLKLTPQEQQTRVRP